MKKVKLKSLLRNNPYWCLNKQLVRRLGLSETLVLQHLIDLSESAFKKEQIFHPINQMSKELGITEYDIKRSVKKLKELGLISVERRGIPRKNYYSLNNQMIVNFLEESSSTSIELNSTQQWVENNSLVDTKSTQQLVENNSIVDTNSTNHWVEINSLVDMKSTHKSVENYTTITNNTNQEYKPRIQTKNTTKKTGNTVNIIDKLLDKIIDTENPKVSYKSAIELTTDFSFDELQNLMNWDTDVRKNWERTIKQKLNSY